MSDPLVAIETDAGQIDELGDGVRSEAVQRVQQARAETERAERRLSRDAVEVVRRVAAFFIARGPNVDRLEAGGPCMAHLLRAVEAGPVVPGQRLGKERCKRGTHRWIEPFGIDRDFIIEEVVLQHVAGVGIEGVSAGLRSLAHLGDLLFRPDQQIQERRDGIGAVADLRFGRGLHDRLQGIREAVERIGEPEAACARQARVQGRDGGCGRLAREQAISDGAEREDVELFRKAPSLNRLWCEIDVGLVVAGEAERGRRSGTSRHGGTGIRS